MSIKITRAIRKSHIADCPSSVMAMVDVVPMSVVGALSSAQLADLIDGLWRVCQTSKSIAEREAIDAGAVWCSRRNRFLELRSE
jgi:hypothetical protein